jgi:hypothetical protein
MILDGQCLPHDAPQGMHALAARLGELAGPAGPGALPGEAAALAAFSRETFPGSPSPVTPPRLRARLLTAGRARMAAFAAAAAIVLGGTAAAYAGDLPAPVQQFAHRVIGAPPAHHGRLAAHRDGPARGHDGGQSSIARGDGHGAAPGQGHGKARGHVKAKHRPEPGHSGKPGKHGKPSGSGSLPVSQHQNGQH